MKIVSWNCRGLGNPTKIEAVKDLMKVEPADILMLQETKIEGEALLEISKHKWQKNTGKAISARGTSGGIATLWKAEQFSLVNSYNTQHWSFTELKHTASKLTIALFNLYVPTLHNEKKDCWKTLNEFLEQNSPSNIIIAGDLNLVMNGKEKRGGRPSKDQMIFVVEDIIQQWDLMDFKPSKGLYTWTNNRMGEEHISARLDRFLVQSTLLLERKLISTAILPKLTSDHKPILLQLEEEENLGPIPFRFSPLWKSKSGFVDTVQWAWSTPVNGSPNFVWEQKLKITKKALKEWSKLPESNPNTQRKESVQQLGQLQLEMETIDIARTELEKEQQAQCRTYRAFRKEEEYWRLKSRSLWLKAGDRNTSYFHRQFKARLSRNHISEITTNEGKLCKGIDQIKDAVVSHFQQLYSKENHDNEEDYNEFLMNTPTLVTKEDNTALLIPISEEELSKVIWSMDPDKAPGPDGFTIHFYRICWNIIKSDLIRMIKGVLQKAKIGGSTNSTFLALIPKETNPASFDRFRPISLCNASYKIIAKLLANRIKPLLGKLISESQGGFVKGRHILDNVIQVQEAMHSSNLRKEKGMLIKLDMANAFDRVKLSYLYQVLLSFGFDPEFVKLIKACTHGPWIAPLVNGRPTNFFKATRGLRQGCPLSPFLYILMADTLSRKMEQEMLIGAAPGLRITKNLKPINHALFADDSLLLGGASNRVAKAFKGTLQAYCKVSGALISDRKSVVYSWNVADHETQKIASTLGFKGHSKWEKIQYLGLPLTLGVNRVSLWEGVLAKIKRKIEAWGGYWLTHGGKLTLIKAVISSLPIYQASYLLAPNSIAGQINKLLRDFLWHGGKGNQRKFHLVNWETAKRPLREGGLQIRDPALANTALGCKILWKMHSDPSHPVSKTLIHRYIPNAKIRNLQNAVSRKTTILWQLCIKGARFFNQHLYRVPGNGKRTKLWTDSIMGNPPIASNAGLKEIRDFLENRGIKRIFDISKWDEDGSWSEWQFGNVPDCLLQQLEMLKAELREAAPVHKTGIDTWGWGPTGIYTSARGYALLQQQQNRPLPARFWLEVWDSMAIPKVNFFFWTLMHRKILTGENLLKRNIAGPHRCCLCREAMETSDHLFVGCHFANKVWQLTLQGLKVVVPTNISVVDLFTGWKDSYPSLSPKTLWARIWISVPKYVCWKLWLARNEQIFNNTEWTPQMVAAKAKGLLLESLSSQNHKTDTSILQEEKEWLGSSVLNLRTHSAEKPQLETEWRLRDSHDIFQSWWQKQGKTSAFFDGASKGNPGTAGAGGIIYSSNGEKLATFCWGLGQRTNNQAEILSLIKVCQIVRERGHRELQAFGDSEILIKIIHSRGQFKDAGLNKNLQRLRNILKDFTSFKCYHILRDSNKEADKLANEGCLLPQGELSVNGGDPVKKCIP
jgi:ribonuclease HI/exonuclease III